MDNMGNSDIDKNFGGPIKSIYFNQNIAWVTNPIRKFW